MATFTVQRVTRSVVLYVAHADISAERVLSLKLRGLYTIFPASYSSFTEAPASFFSFFSFFPPQ